MQTYEFNTTLKNGIIILPQQIKNEIKGKIKVIISQNKKKNANNLISDILKIYKKYHDIIPFKNVDPVQWQKTIRNEWRWIWKML